MNSLAHTSDVLGQLPFLKTYSHLLLIFPLDDNEESRKLAIQTLQAAILKLTTALPWLAAKVINKGSGPGNSGLFALEPCDMWTAPKPVMRIRDCSSLCPCYDELIQARGPASMLDGSVLAPRNAFPESYQETEADPAPVLVFQVNFVKGGLLLDCAAQHNFVDMSGIEQCYHLLATAMNDKPFPPSAIEQGLRDRRNVVPLLQPGEAMQDHSQFILPELPEPPAPSLEPHLPFSWHYFRFSMAKLSHLKSLATAPESHHPSVSYISTNDALSAFCWQRVISVRLRRRQTPHAIATFCRAVDARKTMGVPQEYMGNLVTIATSKMEFRHLADATLPTIASVLRKDLNIVKTRHYVRSFATLIDNTPDKSTIAYGGKFNPDTDIGSSSWAHIDLSCVAFGLLGKPALIRRPTFGPLKSDIYFMPRTEGGDIDALLCFNDGDMKGLMEDVQWNSYADYIG